MTFLQSLTKKENERQKNTLNLIASENYPSPKTLELLGSVWNNKYGEGYPTKRYYAGNQLTDELELFCQQTVLKVFDTTSEYGVNVQVLSGTPANSMVFLSVLNYGDTVLSLNVDNGGHISHLHPTSRWLKFFKLVNYDLKAVSKNTYQIDIQDYEQKISSIKPKLVIIGFSAYTQKYNFQELIEIAHKYNSLVLADISHISGLIASNLHQSPFLKGDSGADFITTTTHKTFRGPRGALIFAKNYLPDYANLTDFELQGIGNKKVKSLQEIIDRTVFPGNSGGPHFHQIASIANAGLEILGEEKYPDNLDFVEYSKKVIENCKFLENGLLNGGLEVISPTENHLCLIKLPDFINSLDVQKKLEKFGIILNRNKIPFDKKSAWIPSGLRLGSPALTSRGFDKNSFFDLGTLIADIIFDKISQKEVAKKVESFLNQLNWYY